MGLLFEYSPPKAHPIVYAGLILFTVVLISGSLENLARESVTAVYLAYAAPLVATLLFYVLWMPSKTRIHDDGIAPSRPLLLRWYKPFLAWKDIHAIYPSYYDVTGAFVSPFASSDGKVTQMGLGIELIGHKETVRFTPTRFSIWEAESAGYQEAMKAVRHAYGERPLVPAARTFSREEAEAMVIEASKPFMPFFAIVLLFASAAPLVWIMTRVGMSVGMSLLLGIVPAVLVALRSGQQSKHRNNILDALSKAAEFQRGRS